MISESGAVSGGACWAGRCQELCECSSKECFLPHSPHASRLLPRQHWMNRKKVSCHPESPGGIWPPFPQRETPQSSWRSGHLLAGSQHKSHPWPKENSSAPRRGKNQELSKGYCISPSAKVFLLLLHFNNSYFRAEWGKRCLPGLGTMAPAGPAEVPHSSPAQRAPSLAPGPVPLPGSESGTAAAFMRLFRCLTD